MDSGNEGLLFWLSVFCCWCSWAGECSRLTGKQSSFRRGLRLLRKGTKPMVVELGSESEGGRSK